MAKKKEQSALLDLRAAFFICLVLSVAGIFMLLSNHNEVKALQEEYDRLSAEIYNMLPLETEAEIDSWNELFRARNEVERQLNWYRNRSQWKNAGMTVFFCCGTFFSGVAWLNTALRKRES